MVWEMDNPENAQKKLTTQFLLAHFKDSLPSPLIKGNMIPKVCRSRLRIWALCLFYDHISFLFQNLPFEFKSLFILQTWYLVMLGPQIIYQCTLEHMKSQRIFQFWGHVNLGRVPRPQFSLTGMFCWFKYCKLFHKLKTLISLEISSLHYTLQLLKKTR